MEDDHYWEMLFDLLENVLHRNGLVIAHLTDIEPDKRPRF